MIMAKPPRLIPPAEIRRVPWRNGAGMTNEVASESDGAGGFLWRVSIAEVTADGPFSAYPGIDRLIAVIDGAGMRLTLGSTETIEQRLFAPPFAFPGEAEVACRLLGGPIRDFNLMVRRDRHRGAMHLLGPADEALNIEGATVLVHAIQGRIQLAEGVTLAVGWSAVCEGRMVAQKASPDALAACAIVDPP